MIPAYLALVQGRIGEVAKQGQTVGEEVVKTPLKAKP
jgi:hypothetical protein